MEVLFITTNTGSFELKNVPFESWLNCLTEFVSISSASLVAIHIQESDEGAFLKLKNDLKFVRRECRNGDSEPNKEDKRFLTFVTPMEQSETFTALSAIYLFDSRAIETLELWSYIDKRFSPIRSDARYQPKDLCNTSKMSEMCYRNEYPQNCVDRRQFPANLFPSGVPSRKGFLRTRWRINGMILEMVNVHLFNDSCNVTSIKEHPSVYAKFRAAGLKWTLDIIQKDQCENQNLVLFGDFNFRLNLPLYVQRLLSTHGLSSPPSVFVHGDEKMENELLLSDVNELSKPEIVIGRKQFKVSLKNRLTWATFTPFLPLDEELTNFAQELKEFPITFPPSYPLVHGDSTAHDYDETRCPGWCDRVLFSERTFDRVKPVNSAQVVYDLLGKDVALGDHKPVYVHCLLKP